MASPESRPRLTDGISIGVFTRIFHRDLVDDVLRETGKAGERTRLMPGRVTVYFVLAMCLFFEDAYEEVMRKLVNGLRFLGNWAPGWHVPTSSAMSRARSRLEAAPLAALFDRVAVPMARPATIGAWFHGWRVMAVDGVMFDVPDTPENLAEFGKLGSGRNRSPFPQVRLVGLGEAGTHAIVAAAFDAGKTSERALIQRLIPAFEPGMLVLCDRGFYSYQLWQAASATGAALLWRLKNDVKIPVGHPARRVLPVRTAAPPPQGQPAPRPAPRHPHPHPRPGPHPGPGHRVHDHQPRRQGRDHQNHDHHPRPRDRTRRRTRHPLRPTLGVRTHPE